MGGGGDAPSVPIWDMAVLAGATIFISTIVILVWTQPVTYDLDGDPQEVLIVNTGLSEASLTFEAVCLDESCDPLSVWVIPHNGDESWDGDLFGGIETSLLGPNTTESEESLNEPLSKGEYRIILDGEGSYAFETTVSRNLPHEFLPAVYGAMLVVWGVWRKKQQEGVD